jgi:hypothetical protein
MEAICSSETLVASQQTTRHHIPEDDTIHNHRCENLKTYILFMSWGGVILGPLGTSATVGLLYQPRMVDECGAFGGMRIERGNRNTRRAPVPLCPPQIPNDLGSNQGRRGGKPATNRLSYVKAK